MKYEDRAYNELYLVPRQNRADINKKWSNQNNTEMSGGLSW